MECWLFLSECSVFLVSETLGVCACLRERERRVCVNAFSCVWAEGCGLYAVSIQWGAKK